MDEHVSVKRPKKYLQKSAPNENSDQPAHSHSLTESSLEALWIAKI